MIDRELFKKASAVVSASQPRVRDISAGQTELSPNTSRGMEDWLGKLRQRWSNVTPQGPRTLEFKPSRDSAQIAKLPFYPGRGGPSLQLL